MSKLLSISDRIHILLALLSGLLLVLLYPPFGYALLAPMALTPLCLALGKEYRPIRRFLLGYCTGLVLWAGVCWWIGPVLVVHGAMGPFGGWGCFALFCLLKSIHYGIFGALAGVLIRHWFGPPVIALLWAVLERTQEPLTLFGWLMLGDAVIDMPVPLRIVPFTGVHGASFLFALSGTCLALVLLRKPRKWVLWAAVTLIPLFLPGLPSGMRPEAHAAVVQPNLDPATDWTPAYYRSTKTSLVLQSMKALSYGPVDVLVWPETPGPVFYEEDEDLRWRVAEISAIAKAPVVLGTIFRDAQRNPRNSAQVTFGDQTPSVRYDKMYLVPFGEYVPRLFSFVNQVSDEVGTYTPGDQLVLMPIAGRPAGTFICYESAVGHHVREFARAGAQVFFNISNDGYFFRTPARRQHLQLVRMRAVENRRWIVRATNDGLTAAIDPAGTIREEIAPFEAAGARFGFGFVTEQTLLTRWGDWFLWTGALFVLTGLIASQWPHYSKPARRKPVTSGGSPERLRP
jgi:apolipoprotein N-acyltransferase